MHLGGIQTKEKRVYWKQFNSILPVLATFIQQRCHPHGSLHEWLQWVILVPVCPSRGLAGCLVLRHSVFEWQIVNVPPDSSVPFGSCGVWLICKEVLNSPQKFVVISYFSPLSVKSSPEIAAAASSLLPQVLLSLITAMLRIWEENVTLARKEKILLPTRMAWRDACLADSAKRVPSTTLMKP